MNLTQRLDKLLESSTEFLECPECGSTNVDKLEDGYSCDDCGHDWHRDTGEEC